jgi:phage/plasmid-like protein (TIGR03299 family)
MAHQIEIQNGKANMAYVGAAPWHVLGTRMIVPPTSVAEAMQAGGIGRTVSLQQLRLEDGRLVERFATVRSDGTILGTVGPGYHVVQDAAAFSMIDPMLQAGMVTIETVGALRGGSRVWMLGRISVPDNVIVAKSDDRVAKYLLIANGHDGTLAVHVSLTPIRVVCDNTLTLSIGSTRGSTIKILHTKSAADSVNAIGETIMRADVQFGKAAELFRALAGVNVRNATQLRRYIDAVFPAPKKAPKVESAPAIDALALMADVSRAAASESLMSECLEAAQDDKRRIADQICELFEHGKGNDMPGVKGTGWAAYNAVTEYITHHRGHNADNRLNNAWFASGATNTRALSAAASTFLD